ncbi:MAG: adenine phosphoribosyltransferase [Sedimentisphaerales bacterium]|nr:adenine phosphoribosyltransferase [Sedimentisphaerales bacterium]
MTKEESDLKKHIRSIPDWPKEGILFRDITPLLANPGALTKATEALCADFTAFGIEYVAAVEARGFIFGAAVAEKLGAGFVPIRKKGKLPWKTESISYDLEYGTDTLEVHIDAVKRQAKVLMIDDLLATGGTMASACKLIEKIGGQIAGIAFLIELASLGGRAKLAGYNIKTILSYD